MLKIINNRKEWEEAYYYKGYKPEKYPRKYPCLLHYEHYDGELGASGVEHVIITIPKGVEIESFRKGVEKGIEIGEQWA
jgi:hypothetical protein